jgi:hypothetical protein
MTNGYDESELYERKIRLQVIITQMLKDTLFACLHLVTLLQCKPAGLPRPLFTLIIA